MPADRDTTFDVARALLIMAVLWFHVPAIYFEWHHGADSTIALINTVNQQTFVPFFMCAFFFITGRFVSTDRPLHQAIAKDALTILLPALLLSLVSNALYTLWTGDAARCFGQYLQPSYWTQTALMYWFLFALFFAKLLSRLILRLTSNTGLQILIGITLCVLGVLLKSGRIPLHNCFCYKEALLYTPFVLAGWHCKNGVFSLTKSRLFFLGLGYVMTVAVLWLTSTPILGFNLGIRFFLEYVPMALWLGLSGTALCLLLSMLLSRSRFLAFVGRLTLPIFCLNFFFIEFFLRLFSRMLGSSSPLLACAYVCCTFLCAFLGCLALSALINTKYLKWLLGRFGA